MLKTKNSYNAKILKILNKGGEIFYQLHYISVKKSCEGYFYKIDSKGNVELLFEENANNDFQEIYKNLFLTLTKKSDKFEYFNNDEYTHCLSFYNNELNKDYCKFISTYEMLNKSRLK
jgi:hypothetical protein